MFPRPQTMTAQLGPSQRAPIPPAGTIVQAVVEQTFGCLQRYRRLRVDDEAGTDTSRHMTVLASLFMTGMRFERMLQA